jgi:hypothetical protein
MNNASLERRLRQDAAAIEADCPDSARRRALWRIEQASPSAERVQPRWPWLASACALIVAVAATWMLLPESGREVSEPEVAAIPDLHLSPLMTDPDRLLARREAALEQEQQSLARDLQALRDHVTASFESKSNG